MIVNKNERWPTKICLMSEIDSAIAKIENWKKSVGIPAPIFDQDLIKILNSKDSIIFYDKLIYRRNEIGKVCEHKYSNDCPDGWIEIDSILPPENWDDHHSDEYKNFLIQEKINSDSRNFLSETDWKIIRHRDQIDLGIETSLSNSEYLLLLKERQQKRDLVIEN